MPSSRQLATTLFADIVGYTATMQQEEPLARRRLQKFRQVLQEQTPRFGGRIVQFYGDGCLVVFTSSVEAMGCAKAVQELFRQEPPVPVRIGLDSGDVFFEAENVYGDSVNTASRIESIGVAGSVLCSDRVRRHLGNQPDFRLVSLGRIDFKNVAEPVEVFALANEGFNIPQRSALSGKLKETPKSALTGRLMRKLIPILIVLLVAFTAFGVWTLRSRAATQKVLPDEVREERVAVAIFNNFTNDSELDALGYLVSEWLSAGLREVGVKTVSPETVREYKDYIGILPGNPEGKAAFSEITNARYLVTGSYFAEGDSIRLMSRLVSTETGEDVYSFPAVIGSRQRKEALVEDMYQRLLGYWATRKDWRVLPLSPPKYEAYKVFLSCKPPLRCYGEAFAMDSTFMLAGIFSLLSDQALGWDSMYYAKMKYIRNNWDNLTIFEKNLLEFVTSLEKGDHEAAFNAINKNYQLDSSNLLMLNESAFYASFGLKQYSLALQRFERPIRDFEVYKEQLWDNMIRHYLECLNISGKHDEVIRFYEQTPEDYLHEKLGSWYSSDLIIAYLRKGDVSQAVQKLEEWKEKNGGRLNGTWVMSAAYLYAAIYPGSTENPFLPLLREKLNEFKDPSYSWNTAANFKNFNSKANAYYLLKEWDKAEQIFLSLRNINWSDYKSDLPVHQQVWDYALPIWVESRLGCVYARQGKKELALAQIEVLEQLKAKEPRLLHPFLKGTVPFAQGQIYALLGEKALAVDRLQQSRRAGRIVDENTFMLDMDLVSLRGYPPFEELIRPVEGSAVKN